MMKHKQTQEVTFKKVEERGDCLPVHNKEMATRGLEGEVVYIDGREYRKGSEKSMKRGSDNFYLENRSNYYSAL